MQQRRMVQRMRDATGSCVTGKKDIARLLEECWSPIMSPTEVTEEQCMQYLESLPIPQKVRAAFPLLSKPLSEELVMEALHKMRPHSSPRQDTLPAAVYQQLGKVLAPSMHAILERSLARGSAPGWWTATILKFIPKAITSETAADQRPLALVNSSIKWLTTVILLQLGDM